LERLHSKLKASPSKGGFAHIGGRNNLFNFISKMNNFYEKTEIKRRVENSNYDSKQQHIVGILLSLEDSPLVIPSLIAKEYNHAAIFVERYYNTDYTRDDDIDADHDVSEPEDDILQIREMDWGVSEDEEIDVDKEIYAAVDNSNSNDEIDAMPLTGLNLRVDLVGSFQEFVDISERPDICFQSRNR
jgi:hypothetical protein